MSLEMGLNLALSLHEINVLFIIYLNNYQIYLMYNINIYHVRFWS